MDIPTFDMDTLMTVLLGMLQLRTEKGGVWHSRNIKNSRSKMQLSKHFKLEEFTKSQTGARPRKGIDNTPPEDIIPKLTFLCNQNF